MPFHRGLFFFEVDPFTRDFSWARHQVTWEILNLSTSVAKGLTRMTILSMMQPAKRFPTKTGPIPSHTHPLPLNSPNTSSPHQSPAHPDHHGPRYGDLLREMLQKIPHFLHPWNKKCNIPKMTGGHKSSPNKTLGKLIWNLIIWCWIFQFPWYRTRYRFDTKFQASSAFFMQNSSSFGLCTPYKKMGEE